MTNIARFALIPAVVLALASPLTACAPAQQICVGPETPDDLEDLFDRDVVRHPDERCYAGDPLFSMVTLTEPAPPIGEEIGFSDSHAYHSSHVVVLQSRSVNRIPGVQRPSAVRRAPAATAPRPAPVAPSRANTAPVAPKVAPPASKPPAVKAPAPKPAAPPVKVAPPAPKAPPAAPKPAAPAPKSGR